MPILLDAVHRRLSKRLKTLDRVFERYSVASLPRRIDRSAIQEGLISALWQSWCGFCRDTMMACATGATTTSGTAVASPFAAHSELEIAFIASQLSNRRNIGTVRPLAGHHLEPTWGDVTKLNLIANGMNTTNKAQLVGAFSAALSLQDLQLSRNASAHLSTSAIAGINVTIR